MPFPLVTPFQLRRRVGKSAYNTVFSEGPSGVADEDAVQEALLDGSSKVLSALSNYPASELREMTLEELPREITRLTLNAIVAEMAIRFPNVMEIDGHRYMIRVNEDLEKVRLNKADLGVDGAPEPADNEGGEMIPLDPNEELAAPADQWQSGFGEFG